MYMENTADANVKCKKSSDKKKLTDVDRIAVLQASQDINKLNYMIKLTCIFSKKNPVLSNLKVMCTKYI